MMNERRAIVAWVGGLLGMSLTVGSLWLLRWGQVSVTSQSREELINDVTYLLIGVALTLVGAFLAIKRGENLISWITLGAGLSLSVVAFIEQFAHLSLAGTTYWPGTFAALWLSQWMWMLPYVSLVLLLLFYPTGRLLTPRWRWGLWLSLLGYLALAVIVAFGATLEIEVSDPVSGAIEIPNPIGFLPTPGNSTFVFFTVVLFATLIAGLLGLGLRYHRARGIEREQMKWLLFAGALFIVAMVLEILNLNVPWSGVINNLISLGIPLAIAIAILRYNLFDIDIIIRRTTSYAIITGVLALIYFATIVVLQRLITPITGESDVAVVLSTLLIAALFLPIRRRVQDAIDRRFNRKRYDAEKTIEAFAATVRNETDLEALTAELLRVIQETMEPESLSIWLRDPTIDNSSSPRIEQGKNVMYNMAYIPLGAHDGNKDTQANLFRLQSGMAT